jgi:transcriptional regulator with XRE-family HTH domain
MPWDMYEPIRIPDAVWDKDDVQKALTSRDIAKLFKVAQQWVGSSQSRIGIATGMPQGRISEIIHGRREVTSIEVLQRVADGLNMPSRARLRLGLAPRLEDSIESLSQLDRIGITQIFASQGEAAEEISGRARDAKRIDLLVVRALGLIGLNESLLRQAVTGQRREPLRLRVLLLDPDCEAASIRAKEIRESPASFRAGINLSIARLEELTGQADIDVSVRKYRALPVWRCIRLDDVLYLSMFHPSSEGHQSSVYKLVAAQYNLLWTGFERQFDEVWQSSAAVI